MCLPVGVACDVVANQNMFDHPFRWNAAVVMSDSHSCQDSKILVLYNNKTPLVTFSHAWLCTSKCAWRPVVGWVSEGVGWQCYRLARWGVCLASPSPPLDNIRVMMIVWRWRGNIIRTVLCWILWHNVHSPQHTYMSSSYRCNRLGLSHWDSYAVRKSSCLELYCCNMVEWLWWDSSLISTINWFPWVLWHCWFSHLACKIVQEMTYNVLSATLSLYTTTTTTSLFGCHKLCYWIQSRLRCCRGWTGLPSTAQVNWACESEHEVDCINWIIAVEFQEWQSVTCWLKCSHAGRWVTVSCVIAIHLQCCQRSDSLVTAECQCFFPECGTHWYNFGRLSSLDVACSSAEVTCLLRPGRGAVYCIQ